MSFCGHVKTDGNNNIEKFPYFGDDLRKAYPNVTFEADISNETFAKFNIYPVYEESYTCNHEIQKYTHATVPVLVNGVWTIKVTVEDCTEDEINHRKYGAEMASGAPYMTYEDWKKENNLDE
tara:strand:+ start:4711 stop:5076 length:366 start_codon:yes stop_codon:yes gene_type:complete